METQVEDKKVQNIIHEIEQKSKGGGYIYRGERKHHKNVSSKLYRDFKIKEDHFDIERVQTEMLAAAKKHIGHLPQDFRVDVITSPKGDGETTEEAIDFEILTDIQHYGGKTNLIDFTTDYRIALFFACDGEPGEDGRIIIQKTDKIKGEIAHPRTPRHRVIAQKSVFIRPLRGFIEPEQNDIVTIPANLKQPLLKHLRDYHGISTEVIYNDLHGFIINQDIHGAAYTEFYKGFACQDRADEAKNSKDKQDEAQKAIEHYTNAIQFKPDFAVAYNNRGIAYAAKGDFDAAIADYNTAIDLDPADAKAYNNRGIAYAEKGDSDAAIADYNTAIDLDPEYAGVYCNRGNAYRNTSDFDAAISDYNKAIELTPEDARFYSNRGEAWLHLKEWEKAKTDLTTVKDMGVDIIAAFQNVYKSVEDFEVKNGVKIPKDIAALLRR